MAAKRGPGRPKDQAKGDLILDAAWELFLERGVGAVSIEAIAARAGVAKMTVYKHFNDRHELFEAAVLRKTRAIEAAQVAERINDEEPGLERKLHAFGMGIMSFLATDFAIDFNNVLYSELARHPELARTFYDSGPTTTVRNLAAILSSAGDRLAIDDPLRAAEALIGMWQGVSNYQLASRIDVYEYRETLAARVDYGVSVFMRAFARPQP